MEHEKYLINSKRSGEKKQRNRRWMGQIQNKQQNGWLQYNHRSMNTLNVNKTH